MKGFLSEYDFDFPGDLIARSPANPRDSARLMVYDRGTDKVSLDTFHNIGNWLPPRSLLVFNDTKVVPGRFEVEKSGGGKAMLTVVDMGAECLKVLSDRKLTVGDTVRPLLKKSDKGTAEGSFADEMKITVQDGKYFYLRVPDRLKLDGILSKELVFGFLESAGIMPLPPYIKNSPLSEEEIKEEYQTVFAKEKGSYAAPTASLHFTEGLMEHLSSEGHEICFITLHVGLGTFAPVTEDNLRQGRLHKEYYEISAEVAEKLSCAKREGRKIIAVGTTCVRALESAFVGDEFTPGRKETDIFINEGYGFKAVDGMVTNFHVPKSSLIMLVSAFIGREKTLELYGLAIKNKFRLFSFGDGMVVFR
jgi:S-adenosylmethionine:tRNA ribosyltransferase-isomerase